MDTLNFEIVLRLTEGAEAGATLFGTSVDTLIIGVTTEAAGAVGGVVDSGAAVAPLGVTAGSKAGGGCSRGFVW